MHVHVLSPDGEAKFWLEPVVELALSVCGHKYADAREAGHPDIAKRLESASSLLALWLSAGDPKAGASSTHSKRFAPRNVRTAP
jgi:hypothetical protein